ncbi:MAG: topoisomerase IV, partial [Clostridia bacterium]|nr:topoisomerase IV [Clostridia bacterium]
MARKKKTDLPSVPVQVAEISQQPITDTIEKNYMPYVMSVIISRAIPEIDGFKPSHRKLLYTMYKMGLLTGPRTKSANVVGQTMRLNPHGDMAIYETMVRLTRGYEALLHPFVDSKGGFGKQYSRDMAFSASRYTEVKLAPICAELFSGIDKDAVDLVDNYDNTTKEPTLLPTTFPNVLVSPNSGIAVGMASSICSFNLSEVCDGTIALLKNPNTNIDKMLDLIKAPDFSGGGYIIYDREQLKDIYLTGRGSFKLRSRYVYKKESNCIEIIQIPYSTSIEVIMKKIIDMIKEGKLKEISDIRDEIDFDGFKLTIDLRRGVDPDKLMSKLFKTTSLEDDFGCNFNILVDGAPRLMGIIEILKEWIRFRMTCYRRELTYDLNKKKDKLHLLLGLGKILLDIDKAIRIVRETENEADVVPNLAKGFNIDTVQAEYIAEIKLRNLNREYILNRIKEIESLQKEIAEIEEIISDDIKLKSEIAKQLTQIK